MSKTRQSRRMEGLGKSFAGGRCGRPSPVPGLPSVQQLSPEATGLEVLPASCSIAGWLWGCPVVSRAHGAGWVTAFTIKELYSFF